MGNNITVFLPSFLGKSSSYRTSQISHVCKAAGTPQGEQQLYSSEGETNTLLLHLVPWDMLLAIIWHLYQNQRRIHLRDTTLPFLSLFQHLIVLPKMGSTLKLLLNHFTFFLVSLLRIFLLTQDKCKSLLICHPIFKGGRKRRKVEIWKEKSCRSHL